MMAASAFREPCLGRRFSVLHIAVGNRAKGSRSVFFVLRKWLATPAATPRGDAMGHTEDEREKPSVKDLFAASGDIARSRLSPAKYLARVRRRHLSGLLAERLPMSFDLKAELLDTRLEARAAKGRRGPCPRRAALAEVHGDSDKANFLGSP